MITASVQFSHLYRHLRVDAEFYKPEYLGLEDVLENKGNLYPLRKYCNYIKKGIFDISPELYISAGIPLIRTSEIKNPLINFSTTVFLDKETHRLHYKTELKPNDIVMTKIGAYIGDIAILPNKYERYNFSQNVTGLSVHSGTINPKYLFAFLLSRFGHLQITRIIMLSGQGKIELEDIRDISVYEASVDFQLNISSLVEIGQLYISKSESIFKDAEDLILSELGLTNWQPKHQLSFIKNYSDTEQAGRIDAEYYQPKYEEIVNIIKGYSGGWDTLGNLCTTKRGSLIKDSFYDENRGIPYIRGADFSGGLLSENKLVFINPKFKSKNETYVIEDDIVFSLIGSVGETAFVTKEFSNSCISNNTGRIRIKNKIRPMTLQILLHSIIGKMYFEKYKTRTAQPKISDKDTHDFVLPILSEVKQTQIQQRVVESFALREQSKHLLECAKRAVEIAIEEDEETAIDWLEERTQDLGKLDDEFATMRRARSTQK